ncbi:helicase [Kappamyces sp. JEL0680]|nr:helicase [Kappamyces sp. JEL0680]
MRRSHAPSQRLKSLSEPENKKVKLETTARLYSCLYKKTDAKTWQADGFLLQKSSELILLSPPKENQSKEIARAVVKALDELAGDSVIQVGFRSVQIAAKVDLTGNELWLKKFLLFSHPSGPSGLQPSRSPLQSVQPASKTEKSQGDPSQALCKDGLTYCRLVYNRKASNKVHKTWDSDGYCCCSATTWSMYDENGKLIGKNHLRLDPVEGLSVKLCGMQAELGPVITAAVFAKETQSCLDYAAQIRQESAHSSLPEPPTKPGLDARKAVAATLVRLPGLGKSLQAIALIWTLLKQTPYPGHAPVVRRVLLVCPASLTGNWQSEFAKWLTDIKLRPFVVKADCQSLDDFFKGARKYNVLVINYEKLSKFQTDLQQGYFDLIICDEGHRLRNSGLQVSQVLLNLQATKRIILSGTPLQNDLMEFYTMFEFVNPGLLPPTPEFRRSFVGPINAMRMSDATPSEIAAGEERLAQLLQQTSPFILRRTAETNTPFLPPKTQFVIFTKLSKTQESRYLDQVGMYRSASHESGVLAHLTELRKTANVVVPETSSTVHQTISFNSKLSVIARLLEECKRLGEKVVLVSHWTQHLDIWQEYLTQQKHSYSRLDGSTATKTRQSLVDDFNTRDTFCFLLSSKAGGMGLNLVGASRLIMCDIDWNPATDEQAMARIWRQGQKRPCFIYRFISTGTIEEFILQRQLHKQDLSNSVVDRSAMGSAFTEEELSCIFDYDKDTASIVFDGANALPKPSLLGIPKPFHNLESYNDNALLVLVDKCDSISFIACGSTLLE